MKWRDPLSPNESAAPARLRAAVREGKLAPMSALDSDTPEAAAVLRTTVNGKAVVAAVSPHHTLLEVLRYQLDLIGSKQGCDKGDCGACTVQIDGVPRLACLTLAVQAEGRDVRTVEGLGADHGGCHPLQDAFDRYDAAQCGFCTPGILMSAEALLRKEGREVSRTEVQEALAGNLCRCTGYTKILDAVVDASRLMAKQGAGN